MSENNLAAFPRHTVLTILQAVKNFAKDHGYVLVIGHSYKDKVSIFVFAVICFPCPQPDVF